MQHPAKDVLIAYANDTTANVQYWSESYGQWVNATSPSFDPHYKWRIKPEPVKAYVLMMRSNVGGGLTSLSSNERSRLEAFKERCIGDGIECTDIKEVVFD